MKLPKRSRSKRARLSILALAVAAFALGGCVSSGTPFPELPPFEPPPDAEPWQLSPSSWPTQRLYRVRYNGPDGRANFKLTLYLESPSRFRMQASDPLGRKVWELDVDQEALWLDHRENTYCRAAGAGRLAIVPLAHMPLLSLPKLLLGRIPAEPARGLRRDGVAIAFRDSRGQVWNGGTENGRLMWWTLLEKGEAITWWRLEGEDNIFADLRGGRELRWKESVSEPLASPPPPPRIPSKYQERCSARPTSG